MLIFKHCFRDVGQSVLKIEIFLKKDYYLLFFDK